MQERVLLASQLAFVVGLQTRSKGHIMEHGLHGCAVEADAAVEGWNRFTLGVANRAETRIADQAGVELVGAVALKVYPVNRCAGRPDQRR
ncbi:hypothetical protein D3C77_576970 [compost metagenome]